MQVITADYWTTYLKPIIADLGVALIFGIGYHLFKKLNKDTKSSSSSSSDIKDKIKTSLSRWNEVKTLQKFNALISANKDQSMDAYKILHLIEQNNITPDIISYNCLLDMSFRLGQYETAHKLFEEISEVTFPVQPDTVTFNILLKHIVEEIIKKEKTFDEVERLLRDMERRKIEMNQITYNTAIDAAIESRQFNYAWELYEKMKQSETVKPDVFTYSTLVKGLKMVNENESQGKKYRYNDAAVSKDNCERALEILNTIKSNGLQLDNVLFNSVLDILVSFGEMHKAEEIFTQMKENHIQPTLVTYSTMIKGYGQIHNFKQALNVYNEMRSNNLQPNDVIYGCLLNSCIKGNKSEFIDVLYNNMLKDNIQPNSVIISTMIKGYSKSKQFNKALQLFSSVDNDIKNITVYNSMLECCIECNQINELKQLFNQLTQRAKNEDKAPVPNVITYSTVIKGFAKNGEIVEAKKIYDFVLNNFTELDELLFNTIADGFAKANQEQIALSVLNEMKLRNVKRSSIIYSILMRMYAHLNKEQQCVDMFAQMKRDGVKPSIIAYTNLMQMYIKKKKILEAMNTFNELERELGADFVSYNFIINACTFNQKLEYAIDYLIQSMKKHIKVSDETYQNVVTYLLENKFMKFNVRCAHAQKLIVMFKENKIVLRNDLYQKLTKLIYSNNNVNREVEEGIKKNAMYNNNTKGFQRGRYYK